MEISKKDLQVSGVVLILIFGVVAMSFYAHINHAKQILEGNNSAQETTTNNTQISQKTSFDQENVTQNDMSINNQKQDSQSKPQIEFDFATIGDSETESGPFGFDNDVLRIFDRVKILDPDLIFFTGDIIMVNVDSRGKKASVQYVKKTINQYFFDIPYYIVFGNHDIKCGQVCFDVWADVFFDKRYVQNEERIAYHSFDYKNTHFVILSTDFPKERSVDEKQLQWLEKDLTANTKENTIVLMHVPPITFFEKSAKNCHDLGCQPKLQSRLQSIFAKNHVNLVLSGHENAFASKEIDGVDYVLSGNATGSRPRYDGVSKDQSFITVEIQDSSIKVRGRYIDGTVFQEIKVK